MKNPRREPCDIDASYLAAYASINDCSMIAILCRSSKAIIGRIFKVYLPLDFNEVPKILFYAYLICIERYNPCISSIGIDNLIYIFKGKSHIILVIDDKKDYNDIIECLGLRTNDDQAKILCLNEISELKEYIECITPPKTTRHNIANANSKV